MDLDALNKPWPLGTLLIALLFLALALIGTFTGEAYGRGGTTARSTNPAEYWMTIVIQVVGAAFLIWSWGMSPH